MLDCRNLLCLPGVYRSFQKWVSEEFRSEYIRTHVRPQRGQRVLDIGCGPGDMLAYFPDVDYVGLDLEPSYIEAAVARFGHRATFRCQNVAEAAVQEPGTYDVVMANGVLHHLNDSEAAHLVDLARQALKSTGRLVTFDGCFSPDQARLTRWVVGLDRGKFVRGPEQYHRFAAANFADVRGSVRHNLLRIPYTHYIMECARPMVAGASRIA